jgi:glycosyltransferase involved in cell wall biosynthesis
MPAVARHQPLVSIGIPAYRSEAFIAATIRSALCQTVSDIEIIVSNDGAHPTPALDSFRDHPQIRILTPPVRLGWVANSSYVLSQATGEFFMLLPHDDLLAPTFVEACLQLLGREPSCFAAYSDLGTERGVIRATEVRGTITERVRHVMCNLYGGYSYRALMRRRPQDWNLLQLIPNAPTDFAVDSLWIMQQARFGELRRIPEPLYWKNFYEHSTHSRWAELPPAQLLNAWRNHCHQMGRLASTLVADEPLVSALVKHRLDARRVHDAPNYLKALMATTDRPT